MSSNSNTGTYLNVYALDTHFYADVSVLSPDSKYVHSVMERRFIKDYLLPLLKVLGPVTSDKLIYKVSAEYYGKEAELILEYEAVSKQFDCATLRCKSWKVLFFYTMRCRECRRARNCLAVSQSIQAGPCVHVASMSTFARDFHDTVLKEFQNSRDSIKRKYCAVDASSYYMPVKRSNTMSRMYYKIVE